MTTVTCVCGWTRTTYDPKNANVFSYLHGRKCATDGWPTVSTTGKESI